MSRADGPAFADVRWWRGRGALETARQALGHMTDSVPGARVEELDADAVRSSDLFGPRECVAEALADDDERGRCVLLRVYTDG
jgi:hypothetical protein